MTVHRWKESSVGLAKRGDVGLTGRLGADMHLENGKGGEAFLAGTVGIRTRNGG